MTSQDIDQLYGLMIATGQAAKSRRRIRHTSATDVSQRVSQIPANITNPVSEMDHEPQNQLVFEPEAWYESNFQLRGRNIKRALRDVARFLYDQNIHLDLVAIGPTSDTLREAHACQNRPATDYLIPEVEFFYESQSSTKEEIIGAAITYAYQKTGVDLNGRWMRHRYGHFNGYLAGRPLPRDVWFPTRDRPVLFAARGLTIFDGQHGNEINNIYHAWI